jgi:homogentisate 1,2-dioxygenase
MNGHGPDVSSYERAVTAELTPHKITDTMAFMFESRWVIRPTLWAAGTPLAQPDYDDVWRGFPRAQLPR